MSFGDRQEASQVHQELAERHRLSIPPGTNHVALIRRLRASIDRRAELLFPDDPTVRREQVVTTMERLLARMAAEVLGAEQRIKGKLEHILSDIDQIEKEGVSPSTNTR